MTHSLCVASNLAIWYGFDSSWLTYVLPAMLLSLLAQFMVKSTFARYSQVRAERGYTGAQTARNILNSAGLQAVPVNRTRGHLTDNYNPRDKSLNLSDSTFASSSIAALGVAAHEAGHAIQDRDNYFPNRLRSSLLPTANIGSAAGPYLAMIGIFMRSNPMIYLGIFLYLFAVLFYVVTLPVEINASKRAIGILRDSSILTDQELKGAKKVLRAAAFTYIASALTAFMSWLRLIVLARRQD